MSSKFKRASLGNALIKRKPGLGGSEPEEQRKTDIKPGVQPARQ
jgi:hypothetical protein